MRWPWTPRRTVVWVFPLAFLLSLSPSCSAAQSAESVSSLLLRMATADLKNSYRGDKTVLILSPSNPRVFQFAIVHAPPNLENRRFKEGASDHEAELLSDGHYLWQYFPGRHEVIRRPLPSLEEKKESVRKTLAMILKNYEVAPPQPGPRIAGRASVVLDFVPRFDPRRPRRKIWLDRRRGIPLRTEVFGLKDRLSLVSYFESIRFDPSLAPDEFVLKVPQGTEVRAVDEVATPTIGELDARMGLKVLVPGYVPRGFALMNLHMVLRTGARVAHLQYSDGLSFLSLFESTGKGGHRRPWESGSPRIVDLGGKSGTLYNLGLLRVVRWSVPGLHLTVVGDLGDGELERFARSVGPQPR